MTMGMLLEIIDRNEHESEVHVINESEVCVTLSHWLELWDLWTNSKRQMEQQVRSFFSQDMFCQWTDKSFCRPPPCRIYLPSTKLVIPKTCSHRGAEM